MVSSNRMEADSLICRNSKKRAERSEIDVLSRVTAIISALVICIIVCLSWAVNHYRDNAITHEAQRDKNAKELKLANAAITDEKNADALSVMLLRSMQNTRRWLMLAENDTLRDDVAAGRRLGYASKQSVSRCVKPPPPAWIIASPGGRHR